MCLIKCVPSVAIFLLHILLLKEMSLSKIEERQSNTIVVIISLHIQNKTKNGVCTITSCSDIFFFFLSIN